MPPSLFPPRIWALAHRHVGYGSWKPNHNSSHDINIYGKGSSNSWPFLITPYHPTTIIICLTHDLSSPYQVINIPPPTRIQYLLNRVPLGYLVWEVRLPNFQKTSWRAHNFHYPVGVVSKPVTYLHPEGKGKEKMIEEETEIEVQRQSEK